MNVTVLLCFPAMPLLGSAVGRCCSHFSPLIWVAAVLQFPVVSPFAAAQPPDLHMMDLPLMTIAVVILSSSYYILPANARKISIIFKILLFYSRN